MTVSVKAPTSTTGSIQLNGSDVLTIDSSGNLTAPNKITVQTASSGGTADANADELVLEGTGNVGINFLTSTTGANRIYFGDSANALSGVIKYDHNLDAMMYNTNGSERMRIDSSGRVTMPYQPYFYASRSSNLTVDPSNQTQAIVFDSTSKNVGNHYSTSTGLFTAPVSGIYAFTMSVLAGFNFSQLWAIINGSRSQTFWNGTGTTSTNSGAFTKYLNANDTIGVHAYDSVSSGNISTNFYHTFFEGGLIG